VAGEHIPTFCLKFDALKSGPFIFNSIQVGSLPLIFFFYFFFFSFFFFLALSSLCEKWG